MPAAVCVLLRQLDDAAVVVCFGWACGRELYCLGCCWAMMLLMFAVGTMNIVWMALLGIVMAAEKMTTTARFSRAVGVAFIAIGVAVRAGL